MAQIIDGKKLAENVKEQVASAVNKIKSQGGFVRFAAVLVGENSASQIYVRNKQRACEKVGIEFELHKLSTDSSYEDLTSLICRLSADKNINGILLQLPVPDSVVGNHLSEVLNLIPAEKDVDGLTYANLGKLVSGGDGLVPCTAQGILYAIQSVCSDLTGKNVVMIGRSQIVGRPTSILLTNQNATVTLCHSRTENLIEYTRSADIVIVATGCPNLLHAEMVKSGAIVIDVGINRLPDGKLVGDVDFEIVSKVASAITPVPGGIGPLTVAFMLKNIVTAYCQQNRL
ncbi:MAG: bifunctional 5,10-methylenetetrahydrofolate dehydrogenase/5,10-methenyltetrahydrofolate cyclohydrolase [Clostridia bacterium]|nr:bifunctional 5,10-methylenetetrahydrofolate dehydrogenase/5,10-methenyltetrahydrofolate cyclohydrolase [Clostridia bacterium]